MTEVSTFRLYVMRAVYLLIAMGLGSMIWPGIIHHAKPWTHMQGVGNALLGALSALALVGVRYPLQMLPLLLFEFLWKTIWVLAVGLPLYFADQLDTNTAETMKACLMGVVLCPIVIPWGYVFANYFRKPGDRWGRVAQGTR